MPPTTEAPARELDQLLDAVLAEQPQACVSVWYGGLDGEAAYTRQAGTTHYAASTMKLPLLVAAYRRAERGELDLDTEVQVHNAFASAADGSPFSLDQADDQDDETWAALGSTLTLRELARRAVVRSGNLATNLLLERVGPGEVATVLNDAGCSGDTVLPRGIEDAVARESGLDNLVTAADLARILLGLGARALADPRTCERVEEILTAQEHRDKIPAGLPEGTVVANKTGWVDGVAHDVALVRPEAGTPYVLAVCTTWDVPEQTANDLIAQVSAKIWELHHR
jgi:beta-lactamase class A